MVAQGSNCIGILSYLFDYICAYLQRILSFTFSKTVRFLVLNEGIGMKNLKSTGRGREKLAPQGER